jgi:phosphate starvation-inducible protein PhoH and related proteins
LADKSGKTPRGGGQGSTSAPAGARAGAVQPAATAAGLKAGDTRAIVTLDDNRLVAAVLGEHDANLALIEQLVGVTAVAHGNMITLTGPTAACATARKAIEALYARATRGESISAGDVDGLIRHARSAPAQEGMAQIRTRQKIVTARTPMQGQYIRALERSDLVFGLGPAGTGKTYLAVAFAAQCLERNLVEKIILSRPAVEAGERLGFLPGDMKDKVDPYLRPLYDALYDVLPREKVEHALENQIIEIAPLAFMRGRTLSNAAVILDEAQNTTSMQMKMFLTRLGEGSKMIVTGDPTQIDLPGQQRSGLEEAVGLLGLVKGIEVIRFVAGDVVRRDLVAKIVSAYEAATAATTTLPDRYLPPGPRSAT